VFDWWEVITNFLWIKQLMFNKNLLGLSQFNMN